MSPQLMQAEYTGGLTEKPTCFLAGEGLSILKPYLAEPPTAAPPSTALPFPLGARDPLFITSHLHTQPP